MISIFVKLKLSAAASKQAEIIEEVASFFFERNDENAEDIEPRIQPKKSRKNARNSSNRVNNCG